MFALKRLFGNIMKKILFRAEAQKLYRFISPDINVGAIERQNAKGFSPDKKVNDKFPNSL